MKQPNHLGEFEMVILAALLRLGDDAYGVSIRREIEEHKQEPAYGRSVRHFLAHPRIRSARRCMDER